VDRGKIVDKLNVELIKQPAQQRAKFTVNAIVEASTHILKELGYKSFTTNKVAERAGVSIGSLYQYFPSKESLVAEIKRLHFSDIRQRLLDAYTQTAQLPLHTVIKQLIDATIKGHFNDPQLHQILSYQVPDLTVKENNGADNSAQMLLLKLLSERYAELRDDIDTAMAARIISQLVQQTVHDALPKPAQPPVSQEQLEQLNRELSRVIWVYLTVSDQQLAML